MADDNLIGLGACPVCRQGEARYTLTKSKLVCVTCRQSRCGFQGFARTGDCDEKLRANIGAPSPEAAMPPAPAPAPPAAPVVKKDDAVQPPPPTEKSKPKWGLLGASHG